VLVMMPRLVVTLEQQEMLDQRATPGSEEIRQQESQTCESSALYVRFVNCR